MTVLAVTDLAVDNINGFVYVSVSSGGVFVIDDNNPMTQTYFGNPIFVGDDPTQVLVDPVTYEVYVLVPGSNHIEVLVNSFDSASVPPVVISTEIQTGSNPTEMVYNPSNENIYVANSASNTVTIIDASHDTVLNSVSVGDVPSYITPDTTTGSVYVPDEGSAGVSVICSCVTFSETGLAWGFTWGVSIGGNTYWRTTNIISDGPETPDSVNSTMTIYNLPLTSYPWNATETLSFGGNATRYSALQPSGILQEPGNPPAQIQDALVATTYVEQGFITFAASPENEGSVISIAG